MSSLIAGWERWLDQLASETAGNGNHVGSAEPTHATETAAGPAAPPPPPPTAGY